MEPTRVYPVKSFEHKAVQVATGSAAAEIEFSLDNQNWVTVSGWGNLAADTIKEVPPYIAFVRLKAASAAVVKLAGHTTGVLG